MNTQEAFKALETIQQSWREDRIRSDLLPAIQSLRRMFYEQTKAQHQAEAVDQYIIARNIES